MNNETIDYTAWIGKTESIDSEISEVPVTMLAAALNYNERPLTGDRLPFLWHWAIAPTATKQSELGTDGHPPRGGLLPPITLERRMWAGGRLEFHKPLIVGSKFFRTSTITNVTSKKGKSGPLIFVSVKHEISDLDGLAITEEQNIVYCDFPRSRVNPSPTPKILTIPYDWEQHHQPDSILLFRYSAATFNGHKIHYDLDYAKNIEGYPGLVVQGPLTATLMIKVLQDNITVPIKSFEFRSHNALYVNHPVKICGTQANGICEIWALNDCGVVSMYAKAMI